LTAFPSAARASFASLPAEPAGDGAGEAGLTALYAKVCGSTAGFVVVRAASAPAARATAEYVGRLAATSGSVALSAAPRAGAPLWHEVMLKLSPVESDKSRRVRSQEPAAAAEQLVSAARGRRVVVVASLPLAGSWDAAVAVELAAQAHTLLVVFVAEGEPGDAMDAGLVRAESLQIAEALQASERESWWSVLAESASSELGAVDLTSLEQWWAEARRAGDRAAERLPARDLTAEEAELYGALTLAARPWRRAEVGWLGGKAAAAASLVRDGFLKDSHGWLTAEAPGSGGVVPVPWLSDETAARAKVASALVAVAPGDPWALTRAAELFMSAHDGAAADRAFEQALVLAEDSVARSEMVARWTAAVDACPPGERLALSRRGAERALAAGEAAEAHRWARAAAALAPDDAEVVLLLGRSLVALGDLVAAEVTLRRSELASRTGDAVTAALVAAELGEVAYLKGDMAAAGRTAAEALALATPEAAAWPAVSKARNTLGKILLAQAKWDEADRHFAEDALEASAHGDTTGELRARLNRGIAFLSSGALDEARAIFETVLAEGERLGDFRASAFALDNLAVVATWRHEYADALALSERTLKLRRRLGDRLTTARIVGSLAELRRKLGLLDHADHAIAFGRRALGPGMPPERAAHFSIVAARVALDRGHTEAAHREASRALRDAELTGHQKLVAEAQRVAARIALEDGDLARARASLAVADAHASTDEARAECGLVRALLARATGDDAAEVERLALDALRLGRVVGEEELLREVHILLAELYRSAGDGASARSHLAQATSLRDQVSVGLPADVRAAFFKRRDVQELDRQGAQLAVAFDDAACSSRPGGDDRDDRDSASGRDLGRRSSRPSLPPLARASSVELVGADPAMRALQSTIRKVARSNSTVLIRGESGTGKELVAAALHRASDRAHGPMVTVNCAALVETLLLSELFGHEKGAFTGAAGRKRGRFELAEGGTLFLDEIGDISAKTQVALLRVLQERTFERVGGTTPIRLDVHIICATHRDLRAMVERGEFREDLYYRLRGIALDVPALRARPGDIPALADHLLGRIAAERSEAKKSLSAGALELLMRHAWPGNVRELENALRAASLFAEGEVIAVTDLTENVDDLRRVAERVLASRPKLADSAVPPSPASAAVTDGVDEIEGDDGAGDDAPLPGGEAKATAVAYAQIRGGSLSLSDLKRQIERDCIARALAETKGNITRAAALLGMKRPRLSQLVKHYGLCAVSSEVS
jgi:transcriptional regulator with GAF, ATPase, and Fis domain/tetratricopeptide (TPR) repeat protein